MLECRSSLTRDERGSNLSLCSDEGYSNRTFCGPRKGLMSSAREAKNQTQQQTADSQIARQTNREWR